LLKDAELPPFLAARVYLDFRTADGPVYLERVEELDGGRRITLRSGLVGPGLEEGASVAVDGACLTAVASSGEMCVG
jgi:hypothetical protein